jgi:exportin-2 (importin alpha re-exporter)
MHRKLFQEEATLREIVTRIVIPNLLIRDVDEERFEDDPHEFIVTEVEGSDIESRRKWSQDLLRGMFRQFETETQTMAICLEHSGSMLAEFAADNNKWTARDAVVSVHYDFVWTVQIHLMPGIAIRRESYLGVV